MELEVSAMVIAVAAVSAGLMAGLVFGFSVGVLPALRRMPSADAGRIMQEMNSRIQNPLFGLVFLSAFGANVALVVAELGGWWTVDDVSFWGALVYLSGFLVVTMAINIPLNNRLGAADVGSGSIQRIWPRFVRWWGWANHLRAIAATVACAMLIVGALRG